MKSLSPRPAAGWRLGHRVRREDRRSTMATYQLNVNGAHREVTVDPSTPLLWVLREDLKMTGTKYGCGVSACGACTVHVAGIATRSCLLPVSLVGERPVVTIERLAEIRVGPRPFGDGSRSRCTPASVRREGHKRQ